MCTPPRGKKGTESIIPGNRPWTRLDEWTEIDVRDGAKGALVVEAIKRREGHEGVLVSVGYRDRDNAKVVKTDYHLSNASAQTPLVEFARVAKAEHRIEETVELS